MNLEEWPLAPFLEWVVSFRRASATMGANAPKAHGLHTQVARHFAAPLMRNV
jgi:hypothetical protein